MNYWNMHRRLGSAFNIPRYNFSRIIFAPAWNFTRACKKIHPLFVLDKPKWSFFFIFHLFFSVSLSLSVLFGFVFTSTNFEICTGTLPPYWQVIRLFDSKEIFTFRTLSNSEPDKVLPVPFSARRRIKKKKKKKINALYYLQIEQTKSKFPSNYTRLMNCLTYARATDISRSLNDAHARAFVG